MKKYAFAAALAIGAAIPSQAALIDDFNRANGSLGSNYTVQNGALSILDNQVVNTQFVSLATYNGSSSTTAGLDVSLRGLDPGSYVALALGYAGAGASDLSYFIKVQDDNGDGFFDRYAFYGGNNNFDGVIGSLNPFQAGTIDVSYTGTLATLVVTAGSSTQTFNHDYGFAPSTTDVGIGMNRMGRADNLRFDAAATSPVPEPQTWAMMLLGFGFVGGSMRLRLRRPVAA